MTDPNQTELSLAKTQELPAINWPASDEDFLLEHERVDEMIAAGAPRNEILSELVLMMEKQVPEMICSILLISEDGNHIKHSVAPSLPESYVKAIDGAPIGPKNGSCGTAMFRGKPVIVSDIATDPLWDDYRDVALSIGVAACWSTPIMSSKGKVLGSFAMYYREPRLPDGQERRITELATKLAAMAIERRA